MADRAPQNRRPVPRKKGQFVPGDPRINAGGKPKSLRAVEAMLDAEHRDVEKMRETFALVRKVAHGVDEPVYYKGEVVGHVRKYDGGWMELYLNRVLGPVKELKVDLTDAPEEVVAWIAENLN